MSYRFAYRKTAVALHEALRDDAFYAQMERSVSKDPAVRREGMLRYFDYSMQEARSFGELLLAKPEALGAAVWSRPTGKVLSEQISRQKAEFIRGFLGSQSLETYQQIVGYMAERAAPVVSQKSWYLSIVGLAPESQGRGLGESLIRPVLEKTDALEVPTYLETFTARNMSFYRRLGYEEAASLREPVTGSEYWIMTRPAK